MYDEHIINYVVDNDFTDELIRKQVAYSTRLGLPEVQQGQVTDATLYIYANGPSALTAPLTYPSMALNGAIKLFYAKHYQPTYWAACDPGEVVLDFIRDDAQSHEFLLASKCHKAVFDRLEWQSAVGRVKLWHIDDAGASELVGKDLIPSAISVTISAIFLAHYMGYRNIVIYGWDGCYIDGRDHASPQGHDRTNDLTLTIGEQSYLTTNTWAAEAEDAAQMLNMLPDINLTIEGPGMIAAALKPFLEHMKEARSANPQERTP